jgi:predicted pyridoxine 5'-phosphate oxidase superfamily flavin-nucleotide-binding protein
MATLNDEMKTVFIPNRLFSFATASRDGTPNVAPMSMVELVGGDEIWIGDNYMAKTLANVTENPCGTLFFWDPDTKRCFQVKGTVTVRNSGPEYEAMRTRIKAKGAHYPAKGLLTKIGSSPASAGEAVEV